MPKKVESVAVEMTGRRRITVDLGPTEAEYLEEIAGELKRAGYDVGLSKIVRAAIVYFHQRTEGQPDSRRMAIWDTRSPGHRGG